MKPYAIGLALFAAVIATEAAADCTNNRVGGNMSTFISGSLICGRPGTGFPGNASDQWQEQHRAGGQIWDHKKGIGDPIDPEVQVGTWSTTNGSSATYTAAYLGGGSFTYAVFQIGTTSAYSFCVGAAEYVVATVAAGLGVSGQGCTAFP
jgi:hypothetical protein